MADDCDRVLGTRRDGPRLATAVRAFGVVQRTHANGDEDFIIAARDGRHGIAIGWRARRASKNGDMDKKVD